MNCSDAERAFTGQSGLEGSETAGGKEDVDKNRVRKQVWLLWKVGAAKES